MQNAIELHNVHHSFKEKEVLKDICLGVNKGEIFGLLGPSGAGKTTLINIMTGQLRPTGGESLIQGADSHALSGEQYKKIGIMMDHFGLYERLSCYDNLKFYEKLDGNRDENIDRILKKIGLLEAKKLPVAKLSKGMKNRLSFARAILRKPDILFLDEPTCGLDPNTTEELHNMILEEKARGTTIFLTTHNMHEAQKLCDHIALLHEGIIVEYGNPSELCRKYNHQRRFMIHLKNGNDVLLGHERESADAIANYLKNDELETIHTTEPDLETIFMELTGGKLDQ
ncbi:MAG: ABC transporter ATP-binding protein [Eubacteriales bacterium]|nr:ABC transporter ATP-binding protein [Eubacteriales bacterium]